MWVQRSRRKGFNSLIMHASLLVAVEGAERLNVLNYIRRFLDHAM
jgi:hypothetical protein